MSSKTSKTSGKTKAKNVLVRPEKEYNPFDSEKVIDVVKNNVNQTNFTLNFITNMNNVETANLLKTNFPLSEIKIFTFTPDLGIQFDDFKVELLETAKTSVFKDGKVNLIFISEDAKDKKENDIYAEIVLSLATANKSSRTFIFTDFEIANYIKDKKRRFDSGKVDNWFYYIINFDKEIIPLEYSTPTKRETKKSIDVNESDVKIPENIDVEDEDTESYEIVTPFEYFTVPDFEKDYVKGSEKWMKEFKKYITFLLENLIFRHTEVALFSEERRQNLLKNLTSDENMLIWRVAFTHESVDPDPLGNYDQLEALGDRLNDTAFVQFTISKYPHIDEQSLNNFKTAYMAQKYQVPIGRKLKLKDWLIYDPEITLIADKIYEDLFEAFSGALATVADKITPGLGYVLVGQFIKTGFQNLVYDYSIRVGDIKTVLTQASDSKRWLGSEGGKKVKFEPICQKIQKGDKVIQSCTLSVTHPNFINYVREELAENNKIPPPGFSGITVSAEDPVLKVCENKIYRKFLQRLEEIGISLVEVAEKKDIRHTAAYAFDPEYREIADKASAKGLEQGFVRMYIDKPENQKMKDKTYYFLVGEKKSYNLIEPGQRVKLEGQTFNNVYGSNSNKLDYAKTLMLRYLRN